MMDMFTAARKSAQESTLLSLAAIGARYTDGVSLIFPGQTEATDKHYRCNPDVTFAGGDRVLIARVSGSYVVLCKIGKPK